MYKGIPFSPKTTITEDINAGSTVIKVADTSVFPDGPNLATIGTDEDAETILYSAKSGDSLSGCTRGVEGIAKSWSSGAIIARNFTAVEYGYIVDNIKQLFDEQEFTARINEEGHLIITLGTGTEVDCGNAKGDKGNKGDPGAAATINGVNALTLDVTGGITGNQSGNTYTIDGSGKLDNPSGGTTGQILEKTATGTQWVDKPASGMTQTVTLTAAGWTGSAAPFSQQVACSIVAADTAVVVVDVDTPGTDADTDAEAINAWALCTQQNPTQGAGTLTFYCTEKPTINIPVKVGVA